MTTAIPDRDSILAARKGLEGVAIVTPLTPADDFAPALRIKEEQRQPVGSFKIRGAWTATSRLAQDVARRGVVTSSSGNHGFAIAWSAQRLGIPATIVMPANTAQVKQDNVRSVGGTVVLRGERRGPEQLQAALEIASKSGMTYLPPYDHPDVIAGQATCALEILEEWPEVETIIAPCGGGGLLAGTLLAVSLAGANTRVIAVEPEHIPKLSSAIVAGKPVELPAGTSLADGMLTRSIGQLTWPIIAPRVARVVAVSDPELIAGLKWLKARGIRAEPSGAAPAAALLGPLTTTLDALGPTAILVSGGNVDSSLYARLVA